MATTSEEQHDVLGTMIEKLTTIATALQTITDEQQDLIYMI
jgi:hypothetical protein